MARVGARPVAALVVCVSLTACMERVPSAVRIGVAQPLSGPQAARGQDVVNGVKLAVADLNASGFKIDGKAVTFEVVAVDDKADKTAAVGAARELVEQKVAAVIGHLSSDITEVAIPVYKEAGIPQLFTSTAKNLTGLTEGNGFRILANDELQAQAIAAYVADTYRPTRVALIHEDTAFGRPMSQDVAQAFTKRALSLAVNDAVDPKITQFDAFVAKLKSAPPQVMIAVLRENQLLPLFDQLKAAGLTDLVVIASNSAKTSKVAKASHPFKALLATSSALEASEFSTPGKDFLARFRKEYKADPVWAAHYGYDATYVLAAAMKAAGSVKGSAVRAKLGSIDAHAPVTSSLRFRPDGERKFGVISVYQQREGAWLPLVRSDIW